MRRATRSPETCATDVVGELAVAVTNGRSMVRRYISALVADAGWTKRSSSNVRLIQAALADAGVFADRDITDLRLPRNTWVHLARTPFPETNTGPEFEREIDLNDYLQDWHSEAFAGVPGLEGLHFVRAEKPVEYDGTISKTDLLFEDDDGTTVLVDLKASGPPDGTIRKLRRHLNTCRDKGLQPLRGVLITGIPASDQAQGDILTELAELREDFEVDWYLYRLGITLKKFD